MFKGVYTITRQTITKEPLFFKKWRVFDGLGSVSFDTLQEARSYVLIQSEKLRYVFNTSKTIFSQLSNYYLDRVLKFRVSDSVGRMVNDSLSQCLEAYRYISKSSYSVYMLGKVKYIYNQFLEIANLLKMRLLYRTIKSMYNSFFIEYPVYKSSNYQKVTAKVQININPNENEKCII